MESATVETERRIATRTRVLLIEDDPAHAELIQAKLARRRGIEIEIKWVDRLAAGLDQLANGGLDVVLLDLGLPDSPVNATLRRILPVAHGIPVVVLSSLEDEDFGLKAVHEGAQDYVSKSWMDGELLFRSSRYAIERKSIEEELRKANRVKDEFLATLSHELRTPIGVIQGFAEVLSQGKSVDPEQKIALNAILRNANLQVSLINDMLDMSRIITGKLTLESKVQDMRAIVADAIEAVNLGAHSKNIFLKIEAKEPIAPILGDHVRLHQVMWNLLSNAIKFTRSEGTVIIRVKNRDTTVDIEVEDNGEGIDADFLPYMFDRFRQQDSSIRRRHGGLGLGLAIVKYIVELHGGKITATSEGKNKGARFVVSLPMLIEKNATKANMKVQTQVLTVAPSKTRRIKKEIDSVLAGLSILAVDDSPDMLVLIQFLLRRHGATVFVAESSATALNILLQKSPDVIISDIGMPEEDGYAFIKKWRIQEASLGRSRTPAAALTAYIREEDKKNAFSAGFQAHLEKPIQENRLIETVMNLVAENKKM